MLFLMVVKCWNGIWIVGPPTNHDASYPRITISNQDNFAFSSYWLEDASYVRLKNLTIGYNIPKNLLSKVNLERVKVFLTGENLFTITGNG